MTKAIDHWKWSEMSYAEWRNTVDQKLKDVYLISLDDAGVDDEYLTPHWKSKQAPYDFVEWYTLKYDLEPKSAFGL